MRKFCFCLLAALTLTLAALPINQKASRVYAGAHGDEEASESFWLNELPGFVGSQWLASQDASGVISNANDGQFCFSTSFSNVEVKGKYVFTNIPSLTWTSINLGATCGTISGPMTTKGYGIQFYTNGMYAITKNGASLVAPTWGLVATAIELNTPITLSASSVNCSDGAVHLSGSVNGEKLFDYYDTESPITSGCIGGETNWLTYTVTGEYTAPTLDMFDADYAMSGVTCPVESIGSDGTITTVASAGFGFSGAAYRHQYSSNKISIRSNVTPLSDAFGGIVLQLGGQNGAIPEVNREIAYPTMVDNNYGWKDPGYLIYWFPNGAIYLSRRDFDDANALTSTWASGFVKDTTYEVEASISQFSYGDLITFRVNGNLYLRYFDLIQEEYPAGHYAPVTIPCYQGTAFDNKGVLTRYTGFYTRLLSAKFEFDHSAITKKTTLTKDLGAPVAKGTSSLLQDGEINTLAVGDVVGYNVNSPKSDISFNLTFNSIESGITSVSFYLGFVGPSVDKYYSSQWTSQGYILTLYSNSMFGLTRGGTTLAIGWAFGNSTLAEGNHLFRIGQDVLSDGSVRIFLFIDGLDILNLVDSVNPVSDPGWFVIDSNGINASVYQNGYDRPVLTVSSDNISFDETVTLGYVNPQPGDVVNYYIDEGGSTVAGEISDGVLTPEAGGTIRVYAVVNGIASESILITVTEPTKALISVSMEQIVVGSTTATITAWLSDETVVTSKEYVVESITGEASVDQNSGVLTGINAGTVRVYAVVNGIESVSVIVYVTPIIYLKNATALAVGGTRVLHFEANCELPDESILEEYEIISGEDNVSYNASTHEITGVQKGPVRVRVKVTGETFTAGSGVEELSVENPVVVIASEFKDMIVGQTQVVDASINHHEVPVVSQKVVIESGAACVKVSGLSIKAIKAGTVSFHVELNGMSSIRKIFVISELQGYIQAIDMHIGSSQDLTVVFNDQTLVVSSVIYSITVGSDLATVEGSTLTAGNNVGTIVVDALVNNQIHVTKKIKIFSDVEMVYSFDEERDLVIDQQYRITYNYYGDDPVTNVQLNVSNANIFKIRRVEEKIGEATKIVFIITPTGKGSSSFSISVNGKESHVIEVKIVEQKGYKEVDKAKLILYIILGSVGGLLAIGGVTTLIVVLTKKKKAKGVSK